MGSKFSHRRSVARKPPICIKPKPKPPPPPVSPAPFTWPAAGLIPEHARHPVRPPPTPPFVPILTRNLIYHVYPQPSNGAWWANLAQLKRRLHLFNGKKIIAVAQGPDLLSTTIVQLALGSSCTYLEIPNDARLRDSATFLPLLRAVKSQDPTEATFYGHTKGASPHLWTDERLCRAIMYWRNTMYHLLLDKWPEVTRALDTHPCVGCFLIDWSSLGPGTMRSPAGFVHGIWHFAGTFFWFRHDCLFGDPRWSAIADDPWANEMYLGGIFSADQAFSMNERGAPAQADQTRLHDPDSYRLQIPD